MPDPRSSRRDFLRTTAAGATAAAMTAGSYERVLGANDRLSIAQIGCGRRGFGAHMRNIHKHATEANVRTTAVCDVWSKHRERAAQQAKKWYGKTPYTTTDYRDLLQRDDIDAVMIATCDFGHARILRDAVEAGKQTYCEKPLSMDFQELKNTVDAVKNSGLTVQIGTQRRSDAMLGGCKKVLDENGLGKVSRIEFFSNSGRPNWYKRLGRMPVQKSEVDWPRFLMHLPDRPFDDLLFAGWYGYRELCSGSFGQFMAHYSDLAHYLTGAKHPQSVVAQGDTFVWDDKHKFTCRDQVQTTMIYPEGFMFTYSTNFGNGAGSRSRIYGERGMMTLDGKPRIVREGVFRTKEPAAEDAHIKPDPRPDHFLDWLQAVRTDRPPIAPIEAGYQHSVACIMADRAMRTGRRQTYDPDQRAIREG